MFQIADVTGSGNKTYPRDYRAKHASAKRRRARSSQSSGLSNFEPMLSTIIEETESDLASQSTIHHHNYSVYGTLVNQRQFVDAAAWWSTMGTSILVSQLSSLIRCLAFICKFWFVFCLKCNYSIINSQFFSTIIIVVIKCNWWKGLTNLSFHPHWIITVFIVSFS